LGATPSPNSLPNAEKMFDIHYFKSDPSLYYSGTGSFIYNIDEKEPSIVHTVLGKLEKTGLLKAVITQNIDLLHQKGGCKNVIEIHGSPRVHHCLSCADVQMNFEEAAAIVRAGGMPKCPKCGRVLKPAITFFGENLPEDALRNAVLEAQNADLMLVLGTSLTVYPAAGFPGITLRNGGEIVIVNDMETTFDKYAVMRFSDLESVFTGISALQE